MPLISQQIPNNRSKAGSLKGNPKQERLRLDSMRRAIGTVRGGAAAPHAPAEYVGLQPSLHATPSHPS